MRSKKHGKDISAVEVTNISQHGFWVWLDDKEYYLPFENFPWFADAKISQLTNIELTHGCHLYWPELDVDLSTDILQNPDKYPLISN